jgi:hypothetical protein
MKSFKVNFKLQHVATKTRPVQVVVNLNTKHGDKYLTVEKAIGISLLPNQWDTSRRLPKDPDLSTKFIRLEESILDWLSYIAEEQEEEDLSDKAFDNRIIGMYEKKYFHKILDDKIKRIIHGVISDRDNLIKRIRDNESVESAELYSMIIDQLKKYEYSIVDKNGRLIDILKLHQFELFLGKLRAFGIGI